jgi:glycosyltransferase involved in cell wall biosynthesis
MAPSRRATASSVPASVPRRRIVLSAFACAPDWGSEPGVGWHWAIELARRYDVTVVTHERFRQRIEAELARCPRPGLVFSFFGRRADESTMQRQVDSRLHYCLWQLGLRRHVQALIARRPHDLIHHLTWGSYRLPMRLGGLGLPLVFGPVGGGETAPVRLLDPAWPWSQRAFYALRAGMTVLSRYDPWLRATLHASSCTLVKTEQTRHALPSTWRIDALLVRETGIDPRAIVASRDWRTDPGRPLRLLYAGRLLGGKGAGYAVDAVLQARRAGVAVELTLAGDGGMANWLRKRVRVTGDIDGVRFLGVQPFGKMPALYDSSDMLIFPSWHDSSGNVVTEALARGLPVLCLDLGGPSYALDEQSGIVVATGGLDATGLVQAIAAEITALAADRPRLSALAEGALRRAHQLTWALQVERAYALIEARLGWSTCSAT